MQRGEIWFAATPGGDRPVLVLTEADGVPTESVVNFDNLHTIPQEVGGSRRGQHQKRNYQLAH